MRVKVKSLRERPSKDEYFLNICKVIATRSTCLRHQFGAVIVKDGQILSTGYNGAPKGLPHCLDVGCIRNKKQIESGTKHEECLACHAEQNAIIQCALHESSPKDAILYCTGSPCRICAKMIINSQIGEVIYTIKYPDDEAFELFSKAKIKVRQILDKPVD